MRLHSVVACGWLGLCFITGIAFGQEWGTLKGRFSCSEKPPARAKLVNRFGLAVPDVRFIVGPDSGIANIVVWLRTKDVPVSPAFRDSNQTAATLNCKGDVFEPHVLVLQVQQKLQLKNTGPDTQTVSIDLVMNKPLLQILRGFKEFSAIMDVAEAKPEKVTVAIDPTMSAWLLVSPNPYFAVSDTEGNFEIKNLPAGVPLEFVVWHEIPGLITGANLDGEATTWPNGRFKIELKPGENDLGKITLGLQQFAK